MSRWVVDTGPLIFLAKLDHLSLLEKSADEILIPETVFAEVKRQRDDATGKIETATQTWLQVQAVGNEEAVALLLADLGRGEAEVIVLARELQADRVVMDDLDARRFAHRVGLTAIGTLGLLLAARLRGDIPSVKAEIERLRGFGFWAGDALVEAVLKAAGE